MIKSGGFPMSVCKKLIYCLFLVLGSYSTLLPMGRRKGRSTKQLPTPTNLLKAFGNDDLQTIKQILKARPHIIDNQANPRGYSALHFACSLDKEKIAKLLLEKGADVNLASNNNGNGNATPLMIAALTGHLSIVKLLLDHEAAINATNESGETALAYAIKNKKGDSVACLLLKRGADPCIAMSDGLISSPLFSAIVNMHTSKTIFYLILQNENLKILVLKNIQKCKKHIQTYKNKYAFEVFKELWPSYFNDNEQVDEKPNLAPTENKNEISTIFPRIGILFSLINKENSPEIGSKLIPQWKYAQKQLECIANLLLKQAEIHYLLEHFLELYDNAQTLPSNLERLYGDIISQIKTIHKMFKGQPVNQKCFKIINVIGYNFNLSTCESECTHKKNCTEHFLNKHVPLLSPLYDLCNRLYTLPVNKWPEHISQMCQKLRVAKTNNTQLYSQIMQFSRMNFCKFKKHNELFNTTGLLPENYPDYASVQNILKDWKHETTCKHKAVQKKQKEKEKKAARRAKQKARKRTEKRKQIVNASAIKKLQEQAQKPTKEKVVIPTAPAPLPVLIQSHNYQVIQDKQELFRIQSNRNFNDYHLRNILWFDPGCQQSREAIEYHAFPLVADSIIEKYGTQTIWFDKNGQQDTKYTLPGIYEVNGHIRYTNFTFTRSTNNGYIYHRGIEPTTRQRLSRNKQNETVSYHTYKFTTPFDHKITYKMKATDSYSIIKEQNQDPNMRITLFK